MTKESEKFDDSPNKHLTFTPNNKMFKRIGDDDENGKGQNCYDGASDKARLSETLEQHLLLELQKKIESEKLLPVVSDKNETDVEHSEQHEISDKTSEIGTEKREALKHGHVEVKERSDQIIEAESSILQLPDKETSQPEKMPTGQLPLQRMLMQIQKEEEEEQLEEESESVKLPQNILEDLGKAASAMKHTRVSYGYDSPSKEEYQKSPKKGALRGTKNSLAISDAFEILSQTEKKIKYSDGPSVTEKTSSLTRVDSTDKKLRFGDEEIEEKRDSVRLTTKGMRFEYGRSPKTCEKYLSVEEYSRMFVDEVADEAISRQRDFKQQSAIKIAEGIAYTASEESLSIASIGTYVCILEWPTIEQFTTDVGISKISEYLSYWKFDEDWKYCINFLYGESDAACDFYRYEAIFSIPCKQYPIPQATASVFFIFELSRIRPKHCLVDVYYHFEGQRLIHTPGKFTFQEDRLFNIIDAKLNFYKTLTF